MIMDLFKPAWQSTNPSRRRKGIEKLNPEITLEADTLFSLASNDPEQSVRLCAIERITHITLLVRLLKNAPTSLEQDKLGKMVTGAILKETQDHEGIDRAIALIDMDDDLLDIAFKAQSAHAQRLASNKILRSEQLLQLARSHPVAQIRTHAAERIFSPTLLTQLLSNAKGKDKSVYRITKEKLDAIKLAEQQQQTASAQAQQVLTELIQLKQILDDPLLQKKWPLVLQKWQGLSPEQQTSIDEEAAPVLTELSLHWEQRNAQDEANEKQLKDKTEAELEQRSCMELLAEALDVLKNTQTSQIDIPSLRAILTTQQCRWETARELNTPSEQQEQTYHRQSKRLSDTINSIYILREHLPSIERVHERLHQSSPDDVFANSTLYTETKELLNLIDWPEQVLIPKDLQRLHTDFQCLEDRQTRAGDILKQHQTKLDQDLNSLAQTIQAGRLLDADQRIRQLQRSLRKLPTDIAAPLLSRLKPLMAQCAELKDWQTFAAQPKKEALIQSMQGLAQDHALSSFDPSVQLESIQRLQEEWRKLGRLAPKIEQELWGKFQTASQQAYAPCKAHFENQAQTREHNKRHRELMCRQLTDYIAHSDWSNADWPSVQDTLKLAREEWRRFSPVDRKHQKALDEQFSGLLEQISTRLDAFKLANEAIKQQLLEQAEVLVEQEISFALKQMQALREQWRQVGLLPARSYKAMNDRFTKLYTLLNERKQQQLSDSNEQRKHNAEQISQALEKLEQLLSGSNESILARQQDISHTEQLFAECTPISEPQRSALRHRFEQLKAEFATALIYSQQKAKQQALQVFANISQFLRTIETKGLLAELRPAELEAIKMHWSKLPEPKGLATASLKARFDAVINTVNQQDNTPLVTASELASVRAREICVAMEILAQLESPEEDAELRMQMQVDRLNQALQGAQIESFKWNESERLALDWYNTGPLPPELKTVFETRISSAMQHTLGATFEQHGSVSNDQNEPCVMQASGPY